MKRLRVLFPVLAVFLFAVVLIGCGSNSTSGGGGGGASSTAPTVFSTNPTADATSVFTDRSIAVTFSDKMAPGSITTQEFTLSNVSTGTPVPVAGTVKYADKVAIFTPTTILTTDQTYEVTVSAEVMNVDGTAMTSSVTWEFHTGLTDIVDPTVVTLVPSADTTGVALNSTIVVTFSEWMNPTTLTGETFTLSKEVGGASVAFTEQSGGDTTESYGATLTPTSPLAADTTYRVTIKTAAKDLKGNALAATSWKFSTGATVESKSIDLGMAGSFEVLANSIVVTLPVTIEGDIGMTSTTLTGLTLIPDGSGTFSTCEQVSGRVYKFNDTAPTADDLTAATASMDAAYTSAATWTPTTSDTSANYSTGIKTFAPGVYHFDGNLLIDNNITISGEAGDVWIFQVVGYIDMTANKTISLGGNAQAKNIFWQTTGAFFRAGASDTVEGIILANGYIELGASTTVNGRLYSKGGTATDVRLLGTNRLTQP